MTAATTFDMESIDIALVRRLIAAQFPEWAGMPITPAEPQGWDNRTFRLGAEMSVRLPSAAGYTPQVEKEHRWLPRLAPLLPLPIPVPLARGVPTADYPFPWSVYRWLPGETAVTARARSSSARAAAAAATEESTPPEKAITAPAVSAIDASRAARSCCADGGGGDTVAAWASARRPSRPARPADDPRPRLDAAARGPRPLLRLRADLRVRGLGRDDGHDLDGGDRPGGHDGSGLAEVATPRGPALPRVVHQPLATHCPAPDSPSTSRDHIAHRVDSATSPGVRCRIETQTRSTATACCHTTVAPLVAGEVGSGADTGQAVVPWPPPRTTRTPPASRSPTRTGRRSGSSTPGTTWS